MKLYHGNLDEGGDFMNLTVNQDNLYLFLPPKVSWMADMLMEYIHIRISDAIRIIYQSNTYKRLEDESTKQWHLGPVDLYYDLTEETKP